HVTMESSWRGQPMGQKTFAVPANSTQDSPEVEGDKITLKATYDDKTSFTDRGQLTNTNRFDPTVKKFPAWRVPSHTAALAEYADLTIQNNDEAPIDVTVEVLLDGTLTPLAPVSVPPSKTKKLDRRKTAQMKVTATYQGGGAFGPQTFGPSNSP